MEKGTTYPWRNPFLSAGSDAPVFPGSNAGNTSPGGPLCDQEFTVAGRESAVAVVSVDALQRAQHVNLDGGVPGEISLVSST